MGACTSSRRDKSKPIENKMEKSVILGFGDDTRENNTRKNKNIKNKQNKNGVKYYLICPDCSMRSPHIEKLYYDDNSQQFLVKYTCICNDDTFHPKEIPLINIYSNKIPLNTCIIHSNNKLIKYCKTCKKGVCSICLEESHKYHNIEDDNDIHQKISKEDANKILEIIKEKEKQFSNEINKNQQKMEQGIDNNIQKLNEEKINYRKQLKNYKDNTQKTFDFLKNLYSRYINYKENNDIMLPNYIHNFAIKNDDASTLNSNVDEILNRYKGENKELKLNYDYGFPIINGFSIEVNKNKLSQKNSKELKNQKENNFHCTKVIEGHTDKIVHLIELASGKVASGSYDNTIRIWDLDTGKQENIIKENGRVFCILEFEENKILSGTSDNSITLWDASLPNDNYIYNFTGHELWVNYIVKCDENHFASASNDMNIKIWDYYNRNCISTLKGHQDCVLALSLLKNKNLCSGSADLTLKIWDWEEQTCLSTLKGHEKWVKCVFELNNGIIVSGSDDNSIRLWENFTNIKTLKEHTHSVRTLCQINNNYFASGSFDCNIKIWEINTWVCVQTFVGHSLNIICIISFEHKNNNNNNNHYSIASCSNDRTIKIWEGII